MTQELLGRVHRELIDVLNSINQDEIHHDGDDFHELLNDVEKALAQPEQEPVAWMDEEMTCIFFDAERPEPFDFDFWKPLYATPPQRTEQEPAGTVKDLFTQAAWERLDVPGSTKVYLDIPPQRTWVGLTDEEIIDVLHPLVMADMSDEATDYEIARAIEAKLKERNQ